MGSNRTFCIQQMGKPQEEKKVGDRYNVLRKGKVIFWNVSESELFNIMEDLAVECYYNKTLTSKDITYEPYIEEPLNARKTGMMGTTYVTETRPKKTRQGRGKHSKYSATSRNSARKRYRGQGR